MKYSLRSLMIGMAIIAVPLGWWSNRAICLQRAEFYSYEADKGWTQMQSRIACDPIFTRHECNRLGELSKHHRRLSSLYRHAANRPWEAWWIDHTPPEEQPLTAETSAFLRGKPAP